MTVERAHTLADGAAMRQRDPDLERAVWDGVLRTLNRLTPRIEGVRPGRAFFQVERIGDVGSLARRLRAQVGCAPNRGAAWLAALRAGAGHVLSIRQKHLKAFLNRFPTSRLPELGFEEDLAERLALFGYGTLGRASELSQKHLEAQFGEEGGRLYLLLHPQDEGPVAMYTPPPTIALARDLQPREPLSSALECLVREAVRQLSGRTCQRVTLQLTCRYAGKVVTARTLREPRRSIGALTRTARRLLEECGDAAKDVQTIRLRFGALRTPEVEQASLFVSRPHVRRTVEAVERRYPGALKRAVTRTYAAFIEDQVTLEPLALGDP